MDKNDVEVRLISLILVKVLEMVLIIVKRDYFIKGL